jgi:transmembrane sensor
MPEDQERMERAAAWWTRLQRNPSEEISNEFQRWISDPLNSRALQAVESTMSALREFGTAPVILDMRRSALEQLETAHASLKRFKKIAYATAAAVLFFMAADGAYYYQLESRSQSYQTRFNERHTVALPDGSRVSLDSNSEVDVRYSKTARTIILTRGRARFDDVHDVARPFSVTAGSETVVAVGTSFDVELRGQKVLVTLIEGRVRVIHPSDSAVAQNSPTQLSVGQQMVAAVDSVPTVAPANLHVTQAWQDGHIILRGEPLADAIDQINRYTDHPIVVEPSAGSIRVSGVFKAGDIDSFVNAITGYFPVEAVTSTDGSVTLRYRS